MKFPESHLRVREDSLERRGRDDRRSLFGSRRSGRANCREAPGWRTDDRAAARRVRK